MNQKFVAAAVNSLLALVGLVFAQSNTPPVVQHVNISELKSNPMKYDRKVVGLEGWLASGHLGVFLYDDSRQSSVRLRSPDEVPSIDGRSVLRDRRFEELWKTAEKESSGRDSTHRVEVEGVIRVLKSDGKPGKKFNVFGQFPTELVTLRVLTISGDR